MLGVDLSVFRFDYDLTLCSLLMNADGTTYHVYGGRTSKDPQSHLSMKSLRDVLESTLADHVAYQAKPRPRKTKRRVVEDLPPLKRRIKRGQKMECIHCHSVHDFQREHAREQKRFRRSDIWVYPEPAQVGFEVDRDDQARLTHVAPESPAARAGLKVGDLLRTMQKRRIRTYGDIQAVLHDAQAKSTRILLTWEREDAEQKGTLVLAKGWKEQSAERFAWRPSKWPLTPKPGFGGRVLGAKEMVGAGLGEDAWAFRVTYIVTWGDARHTGQNAHRAGIRKGDLVYAIGGKTSFEGMDHFHAWFRFHQKPGTKCAIKLIRGDKRITVQLPVIK